MINSIILLHRGDLSDQIIRQITSVNPLAQVVIKSSISGLIEIPHTILKNSRLISFLSGVIVPLSILRKIGFGAYNFHPAPPSRPGFESNGLAIYEGSKMFGTTLHQMNELIDTGPINSIQVFNIPNGIDCFKFHNLVIDYLQKHFSSKLKDLLTEDELIEMPIPGGNKKFTKEEYRAYLTLDRSITKDEFDLRVRSFGFDLNKFKIIDGEDVYIIESANSNQVKDATKTIYLYGYKFIKLI